jgi:hypothetical protein
MNRCIDEIKEGLIADRDWGVYDGALSRKDLVSLVAEFDALERENRLLRTALSMRRDSSDGNSVCSSIY